MKKIARFIIEDGCEIFDCMSQHRIPQGYKYRATATHATGVAQRWFREREGAVVWFDKHFCKEGEGPDNQ
jgi:hypothetical protein